MYATRREANAPAMKKAIIEASLFCRDVSFMT